MSRTRPSYQTNMPISKKHALYFRHGDPLTSALMPMPAGANVVEIDISINDWSSDGQPIGDAYTDSGGSRGAS